MDNIALKPEIYSEEKQRLLALFSYFENSLNGQKSSPIHSIRKKAVQNLEQIAFPTLRSEDYKYTNVSSLVKSVYNLPKQQVLENKTLLPEDLSKLDAHKIVFYNGSFQKELSTLNDAQDQVQILTTESAYEIEEFKTILNNSFSHITEEHRDVFAQLSLAFQNSYFIHVAKNTDLQKPIQIIHLYDDKAEETLYSPVFYVHADKGSRLRILESFLGSDSENTSKILSVPLFYFVTQQNAEVRYYKLQNLDLHQSMVHSTFAHQHRDSIFTSFTFDIGGKMVRNNLQAIHHGENVTTNLYGVTIAKGEQHIDNQTLIDHAVPHCQSNEWYKAILDDKSRGVFNGQVMVRPDAQKTNAFQQNNTILLSQDARMDSKPQLEIYADDVKCSHGATIGQMDEDAVFYLKSRGLTDNDARKLLQLAFLQEITQLICQENIKDILYDRIAIKFDA